MTQVDKTDQATLQRILFTGLEDSSYVVIFATRKLLNMTIRVFRNYVDSEEFKYDLTDAERKNVMDRLEGMLTLRRNVGWAPKVRIRKKKEQ